MVNVVDVIVTISVIVVEYCHHDWYQNPSHSRYFYDLNLSQVMSFHPSITDMTGAFYLARQFMSLLDLLIDR